MNTTENTMKKTQGKKARAEVVREYGPFGPGTVHGVTFDGKLVWFARDGELVALEPETGEVVKRFSVPADAGTAFDGENLYQLAGAEILVVRPSDGKVLRKLPAPGRAAQCDSGMAYADGYLWIGQYKDGKIQQVDAKTGEIVKTLSSDRWVTGVSCVGGELWHGASSTENAELRRLAPDGSVQETIEMPDGIFVSGLEADGKGRFFCGGGSSGKVRLIKRAS